MKKALFVILALIPFLVFAGGGSAREAAGGPVTVTYWDMQVGSDAYPRISAEHARKIAQQHPNITINVESIPWANFNETFTTAIAARNAPDFSTGSSFQSFQFAAVGEILDIGSIIEEWRADGTLANYRIDQIEYFQFKGVQVGIPWNFEPRYILYRADWFERDNIKVPTTWEEMYTAAVHFTNRSQGIYGIAYPTFQAQGNFIFLNWWAMNAGGVWTPDGRNLDFTNPRNEETLTFIRRLRDAGVFPEGIASYEENNVVQLASQDRLAMAVIVGGGQGAQIAAAQPGFRYLPVPAGPSANGRQGYIAAINAIMAYSQTRHPTETKQALKWWSENMWDLWINREARVSGIPVRNDWLAHPTFQNNLTDPYMAYYIRTDFASTRLAISPATNVASWQTINTFNAERWWTDISQATLLDPRSPREILQDFQARAERVFREFGPD